MENSFLKNKVIIFVAIILVIAATLIVALSLNNGEVIAKVGDSEILKEDLYKTLVDRYGEQTLENMITDKIIDLEAAKLKVTVSDNEIKAELDKVIQQSGGEEMFNLQLAYSGITMEEMKQDLERYLKIVKLIEPRIKITDEEIISYFEENKADLDQEEQVEASHILVEDEETAKEIKKLLDEGGDFAALAKEHSIDGSASSGGELGYFGRNRMVEEFETAAFALQPGQISEPVKSQFGYHIIKVTDRKGAQEATLESSRELIEETLKEQRLNQEYSSWLSEMKEQYKIEKNL
ncbi:MAG: foldase [Clostridiaceae bacterium]|nr:foldase [Clostridiaceae bacterium]